MRFVKNTVMYGLWTYCAATVLYGLGSAFRNLGRALVHSRSY